MTFSSLQHRENLQTKTVERDEAAGQLDHDDMDVDRSANVSPSEHEDTTTATSQEHYFVRLFLGFISDIGLNINIETCSVAELNKLLCKFYADARKKDGTEFRITTRSAARYQLKHHFVRTREIDIIKDERFAESNKFHEEIIRQMDQQGKGVTTHATQFTREDLKQLYHGAEHQAFDTNTPAGLQNKVWFKINAYLSPNQNQLGKRNRNVQRSMTKDMFRVEVDGTGREYVCCTAAQSETGEKETSRMFARPGNVHVFQLPSPVI